MPPRVSTFLTDWRAWALGVLFLLILFWQFALSAPSGYPRDTIIEIEKGLGLATLAEKLEENHIVRSSMWLRAAVILLGGERGVQAGDYYLEGPQSAPKLAWRLVKGKNDLTLVKVTIPEGFTVKQVANLFDERFPLFDKNIFVSLAREGYIFPDTYFVQINATAATAIELFENNFERKTADLEDDIRASKHTEHEIITMASILEAEVQTQEDKALVSGILWKRLSIGMALQVDSASTTYKVTGLPAKPIDNPGLVSIEAALHPAASPYLYFLSGKDGITHYAKTLDEHVKNIQKYL